MVLEAAESGVDVRRIYLEVFQPSQREIGRLWAEGKISVAHEHFCTAATQLIMSQLYPRIFSTEKHGGTLVATCASGDLHELGVRMVADFFEMEGWHTYYLGANTPVEAVVALSVERKADLVAISATLTRHLSQVEELTREIRQLPDLARTRVLVGGHPFNQDVDLWKQMGADGTARDARDAVALARCLTGIGVS